MDAQLVRARRKGLRQTMLESRERLVRLHILPALGEDTPVAKLTADSLQKMCDRMLDGGYKCSSVRAVHEEVKSALRRAARLGHLRSNPAEMVELPPANRPKKARVFDEAEAVRFVEAAWR